MESAKNSTHFCNVITNQRFTSIRRSESFSSNLPLHVRLCTSPLVTVSVVPHAQHLREVVVRRGIVRRTGDCLPQKALGLVECGPRRRIERSHVVWVDAAERNVLGHNPNGLALESREVIQFR